MDADRVTSRNRKKPGLNGSAGAEKKRSPASEATVDDNTPKAIGAAKSGYLLEDLGAIVAATVNLPRYRHLPIGHIADLFLAPLRAGTVSVARASRCDGEARSSPVAGFVIWASVSEQVSDNIAEQIKAGVFPIRLARAEWTSGEEIWILDVVAANKKVASAIVTGVTRSFGGRKVRIHQLARKLVDLEVPQTVKESESKLSPDQSKST